ncbi:MAG: adenylosuccinate lyase, partial [Robiginitalea sp.]
MASHPLLAISPIDGRYGGKVTRLQSYFSEAALIRYRVRVEVEYFIALCRIPLPQLASLGPEFYPKLQALYTNFG